MGLAALVRLVPKPGAEDELRTRALDVVADVQGEPGNLLTLVMRDPQSPGDVIMFEVFADQAAIDAHNAAPHSLEKGPFVHALLDRPMEVQRFETLDFG
jgi:quinol monooxygenase YgiN